MASLAYDSMPRRCRSTAAPTRSGSPRSHATSCGA